VDPSLLAGFADRRLAAAFLRVEVAAWELEEAGDVVDGQQHHLAGGIEHHA
jgi:hypothetical protein